MVKVQNDERKTKFQNKFACFPIGKILTLVTHALGYHCTIRKNILLIEYYIFISFIGLGPEIELFWRIHLFTYLIDLISRKKTFGFHNIT